MKQDRSSSTKRRYASFGITLVTFVCLCLSCVILRSGGFSGKDQERSLGEHRVVRSSSDRQDQGASVCWTKNCVQTASDLLNAVSPDVDPCVDFYSYACGGWIKKSEEKYKNQPDSKDQFSVIEEENEGFLVGLTKDKEMQAKYSKIQSINKAFSYYHSCLDVDGLTSRGATPLIELLKELGLYSVVNGGWTDEGFDFTDTSIKIYKHMVIEPFVISTVETDLRNSSTYMIELSQIVSGTFSMYTLLANSTRSRRKIALMSDLIKNVSLLVNASKEFQDTIPEFVKLERRIAELLIPQYAYDKDSVYKKMKIKDLVELTSPSKFDWYRYLRVVYGSERVDITPELEIVVLDTDYFINITKILNSTPPRTLASYLAWGVIDKSMLLLGQDFLDTYYHYVNLDRGAPYQPLSRDKLCFFDLKRKFGEPLGRIFVDQRFSGNSKTLVKEIVENIRQVLLNDLESVEWMEEESRLAAIDKAKAITENIGFPDYILNDALLDKKFEDVVSDGDYFTTSISLMQKYLRTIISKLGKDVDRKGWTVSPIEVNAIYDPTKNLVEFPAAILQFPFYSHRFSRASSYGAIGNVIGHELTHGFDDRGSKYDKNGNHVKWWTKKTIAEFDKRARCFVEQYGNLTFYGRKVNGWRSLSENMADNLGIEKAYRAYKQWTKTHGEEPRLPGAMFSNDQIFFISFARSWCKMLKPAYRSFELYGRYAPVHYRVNATLQNVAGFAKAFNCPLGSPMNPVNKCKVWR